MYNIIFYICNRMAGYAAIFSVRLRLLTRQSANAYSLTELPPRPYSSMDQQGSSIVNCPSKKTIMFNGESFFKGDNFVRFREIRLHEHWRRLVKNIGWKNQNIM